MMCYKLAQPASFSLIFQHLPWASLSPSFLIIHPFISSSLSPRLPSSCSTLQLFNSCFASICASECRFLPCPSFSSLSLFSFSLSLLPSRLPLAFLRCQTHSSTKQPWCFPQWIDFLLQVFPFPFTDERLSHTLACISAEKTLICTHTHAHINTYAYAHRLATPYFPTFLSMETTSTKGSNGKEKKKWGSPIILKSPSLVLKPTQEKRGGVSVSVCVRVCRD